MSSKDDIENENDKTLMSSNEDNKNQKENNTENEDDDETISQNEKIKDLNDFLDEIIDKSKSFEEQIKSLKKEKILKGIGLITILVIKS